MKFIEVINNLDKSESNKEWIDLRELGDELGVDLWNSDIPNEQNKLQCFWIARWCCTDTYVGHKAYFLNNEFVAYSYQGGRKSDEEFEWVSKEKAKEVKDYLLSFVKCSDISINILKDIEKEIGDGIQINFNNQIIDFDRVFYNGELINIYKKIKESPCGIDEDVIISKNNGDTERVNVNKLTFGYRIKNNYDK